jgi:hypothetical protein
VNDLNRQMTFAYVMSQMGMSSPRLRHRAPQGLHQSRIFLRRRLT